MDLFNLLTYFIFIFDKLKGTKSNYKISNVMSYFIQNVVLVIGAFLNNNITNENNIILGLN